MPLMQWTTTGPIDPHHVYIVMATRFTAARRLHMISIASATQQLWSGISDTEGLVGYSLRADIVRGTLATLTAWRDEASLAAFVRAEAHATVAAETTRRMRASAFVDWNTPGSTLPPRWDEAIDRLDML